MLADWYEEGALEGCHEVVFCPECVSSLGVADARAWRLEHHADGSHSAITVEVEPCATCGDYDHDTAEHANSLDAIPADVEIRRRS